MVFEQRHPAHGGGRIVCDRGRDPGVRITVGPEDAPFEEDAGFWRTRDQEHMIGAGRQIRDGHGKRGRTSGGTVGIIRSIDRDSERREIGSMTEKLHPSPRRANRRADERPVSRDAERQRRSRHVEGPGHNGPRLDAPATQESKNRVARSDCLAVGGIVIGLEFHSAIADNGEPIRRRPSGPHLDGLAARHRDRRRSDGGSKISRAAADRNKIARGPKEP